MHVEAGPLRSVPVGLPVGTVTGHLQLQDRSSLRSSFSLKCPICHPLSGRAMPLSLEESYCLQPGGSG